MSYEILLHTPQKVLKIREFADISSFGKNFSASADGFEIKADFCEKEGITVAEISVNADIPSECYVSLHGKSEGAEIYSFMKKCTNECILRQSPHNFQNYYFKMDWNTMPLAAIKSGDETDIFLSDAPAFSDNYTTQHIIPENGEFYLSSGDPGASPNFEGDEFLPYYHKIGNGKQHKFKFIAVKAAVKNIKELRKAAFLAVEKVWGNGSDSVYRAMSFGGNYMHYRKNESGTSDYWIVPGIQYANCQYTRDSFYQSWILPAEMEEQCYRAFRKESIDNMENPLVYIIWSCRLLMRGKEINKPLADVAFGLMTERMKNDGAFYAKCLEHGEYRNWFDICCFEFDDVDTYTQGLLVCALRAAEKLGYDIEDRYEKAKSKYLSLYNGEFLPMSVKKQYLALDVFVGEVLHYMMFGELFIPDEMVKSTYEKIMSSNAKTPYGTKIVSDKNGDFLPMEAYGAYGYVCPEMAKMDTGRYANGGSYHIYEMLFHIDAYLHKISSALDNMKWRLSVDLNFDGTTHEYMHTVKGNGVKENQGWNAFIYKIWEELIARGVGDKSFFDFAEELFKY